MVSELIQPTPELMNRILELAGIDMVLVGGQALAFWASRLGVSVPAGAVTADIDFAGTKADVKRLAEGLTAAAAVRRHRDVTQLQGQITKKLPDEKFIRIDVLFGIYGDITPESLKRRALVIEAGKARVMHPIDVLQSRLENLHGLREKQNTVGLAQLELAIRTIQRFFRDGAALEAGAPSRPPALLYARRIEAMALSDAGREAVRRYQVHVADAIDPEPLRGVTSFVSKKLPQLLQLMSARRREEITGMFSASHG